MKVQCGFCHQKHEEGRPFIIHDITFHAGLARMRTVHSDLCRNGCGCRLRKYEAVAAELEQANRVESEKIARMVEKGKRVQQEGVRK